MLQLEKSQVQKLQLPTRSVSIHFISKLKVVKEFWDLNLKENVDLEMRLMPNYNRIRDHPFKTSANFHNFGSLPLSRRQFLSANLANFWPFPLKLSSFSGRTAQKSLFSHLKMPTSYINELSLTNFWQFRCKGGNFA